VKVLGIIPARGGSRQVPGKNTLDLLGKPVITYTIEAALAAKRLDRVAVTSDDTKVRDICAHYDVSFIERPGELAGDKAPIDAAMRHCCRELERRQDFRADLVVLLYANVPVRADGIIDRAVKHLIETDADSVQTMAPVGKYHPYWLYQLDGDRASKYIPNEVYQRQDLPPLYVIDGAVSVVKHETLMTAEGKADPHAFWGADRRALVQEAEATVDIDSLRDLFLAETLLRRRKVIRQS